MKNIKKSLLIMSVVFGLATAGSAQAMFGRMFRFGSILGGGLIAGRSLSSTTDKAAGGVLGYLVSSCKQRWSIWRGINPKVNMLCEIQKMKAKKHGVSINEKKSKGTSAKVVSRNLEILLQNELKICQKLGIDINEKKLREKCFPGMNAINLINKHVEMQEEREKYDECWV